MYFEGLELIVLIQLCVQSWSDLKKELRIWVTILL